MFSEDQLEQLRSFPDIGKDDLILYFTLTPADMGTPSGRTRSGGRAGYGMLISSGRAGQGGGRDGQGRQPGEAP